MLFRLGLNMVLIILGLLSVSEYSYSQINPKSLKETYPVPAKTDNLLFYLQRTHNKNTIIYELNISSDGKLNKQEPVRPYWIRFEEGGKRMELTYIQKELAYGVNAEIKDQKKGSYALKLVSFKSRYIYLQKHLPDNKYRAYIMINSKVSELQSIFVNTVERTVGFPEVKSIELFGVDLKTNKEVYEKIIP